MRSDRTAKDGTYAHIFAYCVPKKDHAGMLDVMSRLSRIYRRHGSLGMRLYVWGTSTIFQGFVGIQKQLGATPEDELWLEVDSYTDASALNKVVKETAADKEARPLWDRLTRLVGPGRSIAMGEFDRVANREVRTR